MLIRKTIRDFRQNGLSFFAVFLMSFICLFVFTGIYNLSQQMEQTGKKFIADSQLADYLLTTRRLDEKKEKETASLPSVEEMSFRHVGQFENNDLSLTLLSFDQSKISQPQVIQGASLQQQPGIWLDQDFFRENKYQLNDEITINQTICKIRGTIRQPEFIYFTESADQPLPNHKEVGYAYVSEETFAQLGIYSSQQLLLDTKNQTNQAWLEKQLSSIWGSDFQQLTSQKDSSGIGVFTDRSEQIKRLAILFSGLFLILTLITMEATMRRFIKQQQLQIGSLLAQGLSKRSLLFHYSLFGLLISFAGSFIGCLLGPRVLSPILLSVIGNQFSVPAWENSTSSLGYWVVALVTLCSVLATLIPVAPIMNKLPAVILQKQTNERFRRVWLEHSFIWKYLPFSLQWTLRDIQRNLRRGILGIFGAMGCMILLIAAFGINDSIDHSLHQVFYETYHYNEKASFIQPLAEKQQDDVEKLFSHEGQWLEQQTVTLLNGSEEQLITATIASPGNFLNLSTHSETLSLQNLKDNEVILSSALANNYQIKKNDSIYVRIGQTIIPLQVKDLAYLSAPQGLFFSQKVWEGLDQSFLPQSLLLEKQDQIKESALFSNSVSKKQQYTDSLQLIEGIRFIISLLILAALALGITIMMNCHLLIFSERFIEFATLKVLGFTKSEVLRLSLLETTLLTSIGWVFSLPLGWLFLKAYVSMVSTENQQYLPQLSSKSLMLASFILFGCMLLVQAFLNRKINQIDFATALKPAE
ncbi:ABC transporter permease [Candidatus Enterococcus ferrettii]|uniref:ABC3 transporter permease C-terminal domain-containing protein n=1 Tax=Candidatus Enterococcus ferrettii TaxID=2815324 RepID=A0ABV0EWW4_9ENTE|nr:ABC transporter permease [Enterococcus sp. 665A]MBO1338761.1 ABC transporter permease [Enterococcus sp. 665A]